MTEVFISYRRSDSAEEAKRICGLLTEALASDSVFMDLSGIEPGDDFKETILQEIKTARVLLAIIGKDWCYVTQPDGGLRLDDPNDLVRREILTAMDGGLRVIPVLVGGARVPGSSDLPASLRPLINLNAVSIGAETFDEDVRRLAGYILEHPEPASRHLAKVCMLGAEGVGKTSLVRRYVSGRFSESYLTTLGVMISKKPMSVEGIQLTLMLWDMAGEENSNPVRGIHVRDARGLIFVADGRASSLETALRLRDRFRAEAGSIPMVLAANKIDVYETWEYPEKDLENTGMITFTTSAKTGKGVEDMFRHLARKILRT